MSLELAVVRTLVPKVDDQGRAVAAGAIGTVVHVHGGEPPAYAIEVVLVDERGMQNDAHVFDALAHEIEVVR